MAAALFFGSLTSCTNGVKAEDTVKGYFQAAKNFDGKAMAGFIAPSNATDRKEMEGLGSATAEENDISQYMLSYLKGNAKKMTYQVKSSQEDANKAKVTVESRYVDGGPFMKEVMGEALGQMITLAFSGKEPTEEEISTMFSSVIKENSGSHPETFKTETLDIELVKVENKWYINQVDNKMQDVITSGFFSVVDEMGDAFSQ